MKEKYIKPEIEVIELLNIEILTSTGEWEEGEEGWNDGEDMAPSRGGFLQ